MRILLLLRGSAGCGKSTWIEENNLKRYTLCADEIRLLCQGPVMQVDGTVGISQRLSSAAPCSDSAASLRQWGCR